MNSGNTDALTGHNIVAGYSDAPVLRDVSVNIPRNKVTAIIGPNGSGKSTLLKVLGRQLSRSSGVIKLGDVKLESFSSRDFARMVSYLPQRPTVSEGLTVRDLISFGRYPYTGIFANLSHEDYLAVEDAAEQTGIAELLDQDATNLSGGQQQRVWIAMAIAQQASTLLLDEPTTYLDPAFQLSTLDLVKKLHLEGHTIAMVLHDITQAARYANHVIAMKEGVVVRAGNTADVLTQELVQDVFAVNCLLLEDPATGRKLPVPYSL